MTADVRTEAAEWLAHHLDHGRETLDADPWIRADPRRRQAVEALIALHEDAALVDALRQMDQARGNPTPIWSAGRIRSRRPAWTAMALPGVGLAAALTAAIFLAPVLSMLMTPFSAYETVRGEQRQVVLADGSRLILAGDTRLSVRLAMKRRDVRLEHGEAFFDIAHDESRPLRVTSGDASVEVLGTRFMLDRLADGAALTVESGRVRIRPVPGAPGKVIDAGRRTEVRNGVLGAVVAHDPHTGDWRSGWVEVSDAPLSDVVAQIGRWSPTPVRVDADAGARRVSGRFSLARPESQIENLALLHDLELSRDPAGYRLSMRH